MKNEGSSDFQQEYQTLEVKKITDLHIPLAELLTIDGLDLSTLRACGRMVSAEGRRQAYTGANLERNGAVKYIFNGT